MQAAATPRGAILRLARDDGRRAPASVRARMKKGRVPAAATPCGAVYGLARVGGRRAPASVHAWRGRGGGRSGMSNCMDRSKTHPILL
jgi:hypothetical protein